MVVITVNVFNGSKKKRRFTVNLNDANKRTTVKATRFRVKKVTVAGIYFLKETFDPFSFKTGVTDPNFVRIQIPRERTVPQMPHTVHKSLK